MTLPSQAPLIVIDLGPFHAALLLALPPVSYPLLATSSANLAFDWLHSFDNNTMLTVIATCLSGLAQLQAASDWVNHECSDERMSTRRKAFRSGGAQIRGRRVAIQ